MQHNATQYKTIPEFDGNVLIVCDNQKESKAQKQQQSVQKTETNLQQSLTESIVDRFLAQKRSNVVEGASWYEAVLCCVLLCCVMYCTVLYCTVLYCILLYFIVYYRRGFADDAFEVNEEEESDEEENPLEPWKKRPQQRKKRNRHKQKKIDKVANELSEEVFEGLREVMMSVEGFEGTYENLKG